MSDGPYVTKSGKVLTDAELDRLANEAEEDEFGTPQAAALVLRGLKQREAFWRAKLGDVDYERAIERWTQAAHGD